MIHIITLFQSLFMSRHAKLKVEKKFKGEKLNIQTFLNKMTRGLHT